MYSFIQINIIFSTLQCNVSIVSTFLYLIAFLSLHFVNIILCLSCCALLLSISSRLCFLCFHFVNIIPLANSYCNILLLSCVYKHKINILSISSCLQILIAFFCLHFVYIIPLANSYHNIFLLSCVYKQKINILSISSRLRILIASSKMHPTIWQQRALKRAHCKKAKISKKTYFDYSCPLQCVTVPKILNDTDTFFPVVPDRYQIFSIPIPVLFPIPNFTDTGSKTYFRY